MVNNGTRMGAGRLPAVTLAMLLALPFASAQAQGEAEISKGQQFYEKVCAKCHEAGIGPVLIGRGLPEAVFKLIPRSGLRASCTTRSARSAAHTAERISSRTMVIGSRLATR